MAKSKRTSAGADEVMSDEEFRRKLDDLTPEQRDMFLRAFELALRKRRMLLMGYIAAALSLILGVLWALYIYGKTLGSGEFMAWVFLVPPLLGGIVLILVGRLARRLK
jgi:hypothetical protein